MFSLFFIGGFVEKIIGRQRFILFYILSGLFAGLFFSILSYLFGFGIGEKIFGNPEIIAVGASGAIFGLLGLLAVITPRSKVYLIAGPLIAIILQAIIGQFVKIESLLLVLDVLIMIYIFISLFSIFSFNPKTRKLAIPVGMPFWFLPIAAIIPLIIIGLFVDLPIGNMAHLGGLVAGLLYGAYLRNRYPNKIKLLSHSIR
jgi:membrane associated rhomboid family serine protease